MTNEFNLEANDIKLISSIIKKEQRTLTAGEVTKLFYEEFISATIKDNKEQNDQALKIKKVILKQFTEQFTKKLNQHNVFRKKKRNKQIFVYFSI